MENNRRFHVVITNNETGEVMLDRQSNGIIAAIEHEEGTAALGAINCNANEFACLVCAARGTIKEITKAHPEIEIMENIKALSLEQERNADEEAEDPKEDSDHL